jgi:hypothetical protein
MLANPVAEIVPAPTIDCPDRSPRLRLQRAQGAVQRWPEGFPGFSAQVRCHGSDREATGVVRLGPRGAHADVSDPGLRPVVWRFLRWTAFLCTPRFFKDGDGRFTIEGGDDDADSRVIVVRRPEGELRYRLDDKGRLHRVERTAHGLRFVTGVAEYVRASPGRVLPVRLTVRAEHTATGRLLACDDITDAWIRVDHVWLPASRRATCHRRAGDGTVVIELERHTLTHAERSAPCMATPASSTC